MQKKSKKVGKSISKAEVQSVSKWGVWLLANKEEFFLPFSEYPWFEKATISQIYDLELVHENHLRWPQIDVDLDIKSLKSPQAFPLKFQIN